MCQRDWICLVNIFQAVHQCSIPQWLNQPCSDSLDQDLKRNWLYKQSSFAAKICLFFVEISRLLLLNMGRTSWHWNKALCLCCKQRMKRNVNHKLSLMTSTCILIRTESISYSGKQKTKQKQRHKRKGVFEGKTCYSHRCRSWAALRSNKTNSKMGGQKSITLARATEFEEMVCDRGFVCLFLHEIKQYATSHFKLILKFWNIFQWIKLFDH